MTKAKRHDTHGQCATAIVVGTSQNPTSQSRQRQAPQGFAHVQASLSHPMPFIVNVDNHTAKREQMFDNT
ncbi:hypothetical protein [Bifidobacterium jacchi]|nr:hypothetical protein [Bifidobacterium jacchi]